LNYKPSTGLLLTHSFNYNFILLNMKNILLLTSVYPADDFADEVTPVVHYFAREWVSQGYNVKVVHNKKYYHRLVYLLIGLFKNIISRYYKFIFGTKGHTSERNYVLDKVDVYRLPMFKRFPFSLYSRKTQTTQLNRIVSLIDSMNFRPDIVIGHWANPQLLQVSELGKRYNARTCLVIHSDVRIIGKMCGDKLKDIVASIDVWGFRSNGIKNKFEHLYGKVGSSFLCHSGIPVNNVNPPVRTFEKGIRKFLFVGLLIPRKHPDILIKAINDTFEGEDFHITFIGEGIERKKLEQLVKELNLADKVSLKGRIPRNDVFKMMQESDCFIMLSSPETFGLVYLEAMSMGCITIGSQGEGIDGIIQHGKNGFLSKAGDEKELSVLLKNISGFSGDELLAVSKNAILTVSELTDQKVAQRYIEFVRSIDPGDYNILKDEVKAIEFKKYELQLRGEYELQG
jgi:L-malate glycosyltransferase